MNVFLDSRVNTRVEGRQHDFSTRHFSVFLCSEKTQGVKVWHTIVLPCSPAIVLVGGGTIDTTNFAAATAYIGTNVIMFDAAGRNTDKDGR